MVVRYEFKCPECGFEFSADKPFPICPNCGYAWVNVKEGEEDE